MAPDKKPMQKNILILLLACFALWPSLILATGFQYELNPGQITQAAEVPYAPPGTPCTLQGRIVGIVPWSRDSYIFADHSVQVYISISRHVFGAFTVTPNMLVYITGKVDRRHYPDQVRADYLGIIGPAQQFGY